MPPHSPVYALTLSRGPLAPPPGGPLAGSNEMKVSGGGQQREDSWGCCDPRQSSSITNMSSMPVVQSAERAGIGIILALSPDSSLYVHTVCPGGSAENSLEPGDVLLKIGGEDVYRAPAPYVAELLLGPPGTEIEIWVRRSDSRSGDDGSVSTHQYRLQRKRTDPHLARKAIREAFEEHSNNV